MGRLDRIPLPTDRVEFRYHLLRAAAERFRVGVADLDGGQLAQATRLALRTFELECLVLDSPLARDVAIPAVQVEAAVDLLRGRYADAQEFAADLGRNGLVPESLHLALRRELTFDAVMQRVAANPVVVTPQDERQYYETHQGRFCMAPRRTARHLLITVNDAYAENRRDAAWTRIAQLAERLRGPTEDPVQCFADLARAHSECPTAVAGGTLGEVVPGQLYPALDAALFALMVGEIGGPVESELGFHLLLCEAIQPGRTIPFDEAQPQIHRVLEEQGRRRAQKDWIAGLRN